MRSREYLGRDGGSEKVSFMASLRRLPSSGFLSGLCAAWLQGKNLPRKTEAKSEASSSLGPWAGQRPPPSRPQFLHLSNGYDKSDPHHPHWRLWRKQKPLTKSLIRKKKSLISITILTYKERGASSHSFTPLCPCQTQSLFKDLIF